MTVDSFDPGLLHAKITPGVVARLIAAAAQLDAPDFGLDASEVQAVTGIARQGEVDWTEAVADLDDDAIIALIRVFTRGERDIPGWEAGAKSPVIPMVRELKRRGRFDAFLMVWIKANTTNRFLPHGSLLDRL